MYIKSSSLLACASVFLLSEPPSDYLLVMSGLNSGNPLSLLSNWPEESDRNRKRLDRETVDE